MGTWHAGRGLRVLVAPVVAATAVIGAAPGTAGASSGCVSWTGVQPESPGAQNALNDVAMVSSCRAWAVGVYLPGSGNEQAMIQRWNGSSWRLQPSPNPGGANGQDLSGVAATSATDAWAVGFYATTPAGDSGRTLIVHWNGATWAQVPSPNPAGGTLSNDLNDVVAVSATRAWAVGTYGTSPTASRTLIVRWNGTHWQKVPSPNRGSLINELNGVAATSATNAWAVGDYQNGNGAQNATAEQTLILHWNGRSWKKVPSSNPGALGNFLGGVAATSATNAWTVGHYTTSSGVTKTLILHWNGASWTRVPSPNPGSALNFPGAVAATSATNIWAVGSYSNAPGVQEKALALHCC